MEFSICMGLFVYRLSLSDTDKVVPFENTTPINLINLLRVPLFSLSILINRSGIFEW